MEIKTFLFQLFCLSLVEACVNWPQEPPRLAINTFARMGQIIKIFQFCGPYIFLSQLLNSAVVA